MRLTGTSVVVANLNREVAGIEHRSKDGMWMALAIINRKAGYYTPVDTGNLVNSRYTNVHERNGKIVGEIGYTAAYAPFVHENTEASFRKPGSCAKFLERAVAESHRWVVQVLKQSGKV